MIYDNNIIKPCEHDSKNSACSKQEFISALFLSNHPSSKSFCCCFKLFQFKKRLPFSIISFLIVWL